MCGIVAAFDIKNSNNLRDQVLEMSRRIRHRGPDWSGIYTSENAILSHERLSIVDPKSCKLKKYISLQGQLLIIHLQMKIDVKGNILKNYLLK